MATKKVEGKSKKSKSSTPKKGNNKSSINKNKKTVVVEEEEKDIKKVTSNKDSLKEVKKNKKNNYDEDFEEYDDEEVTEEKEELDEEVKKEESEEVSNKPEKKHKPKKNKSVTGDSFFEQNSELFSLIKILVVVVVIIGLVYLLTALLNGDFKNKDKETEEDLESVEELPGTFDNSKILANSIFSKKDKEYYVFAFDSSDTYGENYYSVLLSDYSYIDDEDLLPMFFVDLSDKFNSDYVAKDEESGNKKAQKVADLKLKNPTVIHIKRGKNVNYYEGDEATKFLVDLIKSYQDKDEEEEE